MAEENKKNNDETLDNDIESQVDENEVNCDCSCKDAEQSHTEKDENDTGESADKCDINMYSQLQKKYEIKEKEASEYLDMLKRTMADFDNFRKRTAKEKENIYDDAVSFTVKQFLPVLDNLERAVEYNIEDNSLIEGVQMVLKLFRDTLAKMEIEELKAVGEKFNPELHNAVMHVEDENYGENEVIEVLQKGYKYKDKILRYSMVKVAN